MLSGENAGWHMRFREEVIPWKSTAFSHVDLTLAKNQQGARL